MRNWSEKPWRTCFESALGQRSKLNQNLRSTPCLHRPLARALRHPPSTPSGRIRPEPSHADQETLGVARRGAIREHP
jgi:hypothetical protein